MEAIKEMEESKTKQQLFSKEDLKKLIVPLLFEQALAITVGMADTVMISSAGEAAVSAALSAHGAVCVGEPSAEGKLGPPSLSFDALARLADYVLVEADGSRRLPLKAHAPHEPVIPANAQRVVLVVGADGFGKPIRDVCHRSERYAALCGVSENALVTPELEATLILAEGLGDRVYINKVETAEDYDRAAALANRLTCPVTAGSLHKGVYLCLR